MTDLPGTTDPGPIGDVREGMTVLDESGEQLGSVEEVRMGDPGATTSAGQDAQRGEGFMQSIANVFAGSSGVPPQEQERLARVGFLKVDRGALHGDSYVAADRILRVDGDTVHLRAPQAG